jgi:glyoxylase-like metal-dependent hydrolase (beta-lactamase superfamily II)
VLDLPVADPWFVVDVVDDGITMISEPHVHPLLRCNVWHVRGRDVDLVVDTSLGLRPLRHLIEHEVGHDVLAVATHVHADHVGGMYEFDRRAIHPFEADRLAAPGFAASACGSRRLACCSPVTRCTTGRCSTSSTGATSRRTSPR